MIKKKYKMCGKAAFESINHIIGECSKITHREYKRRHDWAGREFFGRFVKNVDSKPLKRGISMGLMHCMGL